MRSSSSAAVARVSADWPTKHREDLRGHHAGWDSGECASSLSLPRLRPQRLSQREWPSFAVSRHVERARIGDEKDLLEEDAARIEEEAGAEIVVVAVELDHLSACKAAGKAAISIRGRDGAW